MPDPYELSSHHLDLVKVHLIGACRGGSNEKQHEHFAVINLEKAIEALQIGWRYPAYKVEISAITAEAVVNELLKRLRDAAASTN